MPDPNITRVNRTPYSWTSATHFLNGLPYKGLRATNFKETREATLVGDAQQDGVPIGLTSGIYKLESLSFTMLRDSAYAFMADLATSTGTGSFGDADFTYGLQLFEPVTTLTGVPSVPQTTLITGCRVTGVEDKQEYGSEALVTEFTCMALYLVRSPGLTLFSQIRALL